MCLERKAPRVAEAVTPSAAASAHEEPSTVPKRAGLVLGALILVAAVANLEPGGRERRAAVDRRGSSTPRRRRSNLIAVGYSLGLAASVLYFGAVGDRYGRKLLLVLGMALAIPAWLLAAWAPSDRRAVRRAGARRAVRPAWRTRRRSR